MKTIYRQIVAAVIFSQDQKIFMGKKDPQSGGVYSDCWHIPGGGVEQGETKEQALIRELQEEIGLDISGLPLKLIDEKGKGESTKVINGETVSCQMNFTVYKVQLLHNADQIHIELNDDLVQYAWVELSQLKDYPLTPPSVRLFTLMGYLEHEYTSKKGLHYS